MGWEGKGVGVGVRGGVGVGRLGRDGLFGGSFLADWITFTHLSHSGSPLLHARL